MGHPLRMYESSSCWFITLRCFQARKLMTPRDERVREVCGGVLARAAELYNVKLYAYVFMSNHLHLVIGARGPAIADFTKHLSGNLSKKLGPLCAPRWFGCFWERRPSIAPILDEGALEERVRYVLAHGVKEGLVHHADEWEGLHCAQQMAAGQPLRFRWFNWTRRWAAKHRSGFRDGQVAGRYDDEWATPVELRLTPLPSQERMSVSERRAWVAKVLRAAKKARGGRPAMGMEAVKQERSTRPLWRKLSVRPLCHAASKELWVAWVIEYRAFVRHFFWAARSWLEGDVSASFPFGCFKPHVRHHVQIV
jgi:REP element-mobilizing transposase RayT